MTGSDTPVPWSVSPDKAAETVTVTISGDQGPTSVELGVEDAEQLQGALAISAALVSREQRLAITVGVDAVTLERLAALERKATGGRYGLGVLTVVLDQQLLAILEERVVAHARITQPDYCFQHRRTGCGDTFGVHVDTENSDEGNDAQL